MLDFQHLDDRSELVQIFYGNMTTAIGLNQVWVKPRGIITVNILALGQGGNGTVGSVGATATGGVGGGSGGQSYLTIPARLIPDILYIGAGAGGTGTAVATIIAARAHGATAASIPLVQDTYLIANGAIGNAVTAGGLATVASCLLSGRGIAAFLGGFSGGNGGAVTPTAGTAVGAITTGLMVSGGGGGGGMSAAASTAGGAGFTTALQTGYAGATGGAAGTSGVAGGNGQNAINDITRMVFGGGAGGGSGFPTATASAGGSGGAGGYGCGGGGGGGAVTGQAAGAAGKGGQGLVIITCW
jgi:hypothetical protein